MTEPRHEALAELTSADAATRQRAVREAGATAPLPALTSLARDDPSPWVRLEAVTALAGLGSAGVPALTLALADPALWVRLHAARLLSTLGEAGTVALLSVEQSRCVEASQAAAWARGLTRAVRSVAELIATLAWEEGGTWLAADAALPRLDRAQVAEVRGALDRPEPRERGAAARALGVIGDPDAIDDLVPLLRDGEDHVCQLAAEALGRVGNPRAVPALVAALDDASELVALKVVGALGSCRDRRAVPALARVLLSGHWILAGAAAWALGAIGGPEAHAALTTAAAAGQAGHTEAGEVLAGCVDDAHWRAPVAAPGELPHRSPRI